MRTVRLLLACVSIAIAGALAEADHALDAAGSSGAGAASGLLPVVATVDAIRLLGEESVALVGWVQVSRGEVRLEDGFRVADLDVEAVVLQGASRLGFIAVSQRPGYPSTGELRGVEPGQDLPAASFLDLRLEVSAPDAPLGPLLLHNEAALHVAPVDSLVRAWPPLGVAYELESLLGSDNDGDGAVDEDTADDDGDGFVDEDRPGADPATPGFQGCGDDADCDGREGEDPPLDLCSAAVCDGDGDGLIDEDPACIPLLNSAGTHLKLGLCVHRFVLQFAPALPSYSVGRDGPSSLHPADVFGLTPRVAGSSAQAPFLRISCANLGLTAAGCGDAGDDVDDLDALSFGDDLPAAAGLGVDFSVAAGALGARGSAVAEQTACPPAVPGSSPEPEPDVFRSVLDGGNTHLFDGNGPVGACAAAFPLGLVEAATVREDLDALGLLDASAVDVDGDGVPDRAVYFSLDVSSPSLADLGFAPGDVLTTVDGAPPSVYASAEALGLRPGDDLDALCLREGGDGVYGSDDALYFSLAMGSPTLARTGAGPGDILSPGNPPAIAQTAASLGLLASDDVNALACRALGEAPKASGDVNCDGVTNSIDAALVLQHEAGRLQSLACPQGADVNADGGVDGVDALLILQYEAGLVTRLPVR